MSDLRAALERIANLPPAMGTRSDAMDLLDEAKSIAREALASPATESEAQAGLGERDLWGAQPSEAELAAHDYYLDSTPRTPSGRALAQWLAAPSPVDPDKGRDLIIAIEAEATPVAPEPRLDVERLALALMGSSVGTCHHHPAWTERAALAQARRLADEYANPVNPDDRDAIREYAEYPSQAEATEPETVE